MTDSSVTPVKITRTTYINGFEYVNDTLQFIGGEEGRMRRAYHKYLNGTSAYGWEYDYFLRDHLGNTRTVLTEQKDTAQYIATMEAAYRNTENALFYNLPATNVARASVGYPADLSVTNPNDSVAQLNGSGQKVGPAIILKVMSGDKVDIGTNYYYTNVGANIGQTLSPSDLINSLASGIVGVSGGLHGSFGDLTASSSGLSGALNSFITNNNGTQAGKPNAYLNWVLLDNQFGYVGSNGQSGAIQVRDAGTTSGGGLQTPLAQPGIQIKTSGYLYIYVSNATPGWNVFFDNLSVKLYSGPMVEETHYYPFGLSMSGISDKALKSNYAENKYRYNKGTALQNKELFDGSGLELYTTDHRLYDPQLGRFAQVDAYADVFENWSPYTYAIDNPILLNDPSGLMSDSSHPQDRAPVTVTAKKTSSSPAATFTDNRPQRKNPNYILGGNQPAYNHYTQTPPGQWDPAKTKQFVKVTGAGLAIIPIGGQLKAIYSAYKVFQAIKEAEAIPETAEKVADFALNKKGAAMKGWKGGGKFDNDGSGGGEVLDKTDADGNPITYKEYDVWPRVPGQNRGAERVVIGSDKSAYYTGDHYQTFIKIK